MIVRASALEMGVGRFSRLLRGVGVLAMPDMGLDIMRCIESICKFPLGAGMLQLLVPGEAVGVFIDHRSVVNGVEVTH